MKLFVAYDKSPFCPLLFLANAAGGQFVFSFRQTTKQYTERPPQRS
jgi:hypothetical protein